MLSLDYHLPNLSDTLSDGTVSDPYGLPLCEHSQGRPQFLLPLLTREQVKLRTSNLAGNPFGSVLCIAPVSDVSKNQVPRPVPDCSVAVSLLMQSVKTVAPPQCPYETSHL